MRPRLRSLAGQSLIYGLGGIGSKLVGVFLLPVYLRPEYAGKAAFGEAELVMASVTAVAIALRLGVTSAMSRFTLGDADNADWRPVIQTVFVVVLASSTISVVVGLLLLGQIAALLEVSRNVAAIGLAGLWVTMNYDVLVRIYRIEQRPRAFVVYSLLNVGLTIVFTVLLVIVMHQKAGGILLANFAGSYVVYVLLVVARRATIGVRGFDRVLLRRIMDFSLPLMPAGLALWALNFADRFQVQRLAGKAELGSYSTAAKIALGIMLALGAFQTAWPPFAHAIRDDRAARATFRAVFSYWMIAMCWALVAVTFVSAPYVAMLMPANVRDSLPVIPLLMGGSVLYGSFMVVNMGVNLSMRTRMTPVITTLAAAANIGLNFVMIPAWGIVGAGVSTVVGYALLVVLGWWNAQQSYPVSYDWSRVLRVVAVTSGYVALSLWAVPESGAVPILLRLALIASFPAGLLAVGALTPSDRRRLAGLLQMRRVRSSAV